MKSNFSKLSFQDLLNYNPYEKEFSFRNDGLDTADFDEVFVEIPEFRIEEQRLIEILDPDEDNRKNLVTLSGYSGNGKTTFLNWIKPRFEARGYYFKINNIIKEGVGHITSEELISKSMASELIAQLQSSQCRSFKAICENQEIFFTAFDIHIDTNRYEEKQINLYKELQKISESDVLNTDYATLNRLVDSLPLKQILIIYFLEHLIKNNDAGRKRCIFCFDNLDEIEFEYLTEKFWETFLDIKSLMITFSQKLKLEIDFTKHVFFIFVFREATLQIRNAHFTDRFLSYIGKTRMILTGSARDIVKKRIAVAEKYFDDKKLQSMVFELTKILSQDIFTDKILLPLFNFDYRSLNRTIHQILKDENSRKIVDIYRRTKKEFEIGETNDINLKDDILYGLRGSVLFLFISFLFDNKKFHEFAAKQVIVAKDIDDSEIGSMICRPSRMLLTAIFSLSYPNAIPKDHTNRMLIKPQQVGLLHLYNTIKDIPSVKDSFFIWLSKLFDVKMGSWAHMVSIFDKEISHGPDNNIDFTIEIGKILQLEKSTKNYPEVEKELNEIKVCINASGYIYLSIIMVHYEYFINVLNTTGRNHKPLFQALDYNFKENKFDFEIIMNDVFEYVKDLKKKLDDSLEHVILKRGYTFNEYVNSAFAFKRHENVPKMLYSTRIITTHIQYLDSFRFFIFKSRAFEEMQAQVAGNPSLNFTMRSKEKINETVLAQIEKYVKLLDSGLKEAATDPKVRTFEEKINQIRVQGIDDTWTKILL